MIMASSSRAGGVGGSRVAGGMSAAFTEKCQRERDKLKERIALQLQDNMRDLLHDSSEADLIFVVPGEELPVHRCILKLRVPELYDIMTRYSPNTSKIHLNFVDAEEFREVLHYAYCEEDQNRCLYPEIQVGTVEDALSRIITLCRQRLQQQSPAGVPIPTSTSSSAAAAAVSSPVYSDQFSDADFSPSDSNVCGAAALDGVRRCAGVVNTEEDTDIRTPLTLSVKREHDVNAAEQHRNNPSAAAANTFCSSGTSPSDNQQTSSNNGDNKCDNSDTIGDNVLISNGKERTSQDSRFTRDNSQDSSYGFPRLRDSLSPSEEGGEGDCVEEENGTCSKLGADLLQMFRSGQDTDQTIKVGDTLFQAHRCVLCARSEWFATMLSGSWCESTASTINLHGFSHAAVDAMLVYIYSGCVDLPTGASYVELAAMSDMYGLSGLKEIISYNLKKTKCHFFHKPCSGCIPGVGETLPLAYTYGLTDVWDRCLRWTARYFCRLWADRQFAGMHQEIRDKCVQAVIMEITDASVLCTYGDCERLCAQLSTVQWARPIVAMANRVSDASLGYLAHRFCHVIKSSTFARLSQSTSLGLSMWRDVLCASIHQVPLNHACDVYASIEEQLQQADKENCSYSEEFKELLGELMTSAAAHIGRHIQQVVNTPGWNRALSTDTQNKLMQGGLFITVGDDSKVPRPPPKLTSKRASPASSPSSSLPRPRSAVSAAAPSSPSPRPRSVTRSTSSPARHVRPRSAQNTTSSSSSSSNTQRSSGQGQLRSSMNSAAIASTSNQHKNTSQSHHQQPQQSTVNSTSPSQNRRPRSAQSSSSTTYSAANNSNSTRNTNTPRQQQAQNTNTVSASASVPQSPSLLRRAHQPQQHQQQQQQQRPRSAHATSYSGGNSSQLSRNVIPSVRRSYSQQQDTTNSPRLRRKLPESPRKTADTSKAETSTKVQKADSSRNSTSSSKTTAEIPRNAASSRNSSVSSGKSVDSTRKSFRNSNPSSRKPSDSNKRKDGDISRTTSTSSQRSSKGSGPLTNTTNTTNNTTNTTNTTTQNGNNTHEPRISLTQDPTDGAAYGGARPKAVHYLETEKEECDDIGEEGGLLLRKKGLSRFSSGSLDRSRSKGSLDLSRSGEMTDSRGEIARPRSKEPGRPRSRDSFNSMDLGKSGSSLENSSNLGNISSSKELGTSSRSSSKELGRSSSKELGKSSSKELGKSSSKELGTPSRSNSKELGRSNSKELNNSNKNHHRRTSSQKSSVSSISSASSLTSKSQTSKSSTTKAAPSSSTSSTSAATSTTTSLNKHHRTLPSTPKHMTNPPVMPRSPRLSRANTTATEKPSPRPRPPKLSDRSKSLQEEAVSKSPRLQRRSMMPMSPRSTIPQRRQRSLLLSEENTNGGGICAGDIVGATPVDVGISMDSTTDSMTTSGFSGVSGFSSTKATVNSSLFTPSSEDSDYSSSDVFAAAAAAVAVVPSLPPIDDSEREGCTFQQQGIVQYLDVTFKPGLLGQQMV